MDRPRHSRAVDLLMDRIDPDCIPGDVDQPLLEIAALEYGFDALYPFLARRGGEFRCAVALCHPSGTETLTAGVMRGRVIRELRGSGGFGYDVLFVPQEQEGDLTSAELAPDAKDRISHRGKALRSITPTVVDLLRS